MKHLFILSLFIFFAATVEAKHPVVQESMSDAQSFRVQAASPEKEAARDVAGESFKQRRHQRREKAQPIPAPIEKTDSEVQYWQYSE